MRLSTNTGLIPQPKNLRYRRRSEKVQSNILPLHNICKQIQLSVRPFGDIFNPYSTRCSVLCNHPAPTILRSIIRNAKNSKSPDCKNCNKPRNEFENFELDENDTIPDEFFRRYRDTDSRPMTPSATTTSVKARTSAAGSIMNSRRCITPEWGKAETIKRKKIILDLRRSHSQETVISKGASDLSHSFEAAKSTKFEGKNVEDVKSKSTSSLPVFQESSSVDIPQSPILPQPPISTPTNLHCINDRDDIDEQDDIRRGRKRKKLKQPVATFHLNKDPETQVSTLGPESVNVSTRPSLIPTAIPEDFGLQYDVIQQSEEAEALKESYLTEEAFHVLATELDVNLLEDTFERYLNRALHEAMKFISLKKPNKNIQNEDLEGLSEKFGKLSYEEDLKMPRKLSKSANRFEIPMDLYQLQSCSVLDYLSKYVWVSRQRKQMYKKVFLKYIDLSEEIQTERVILIVNFEKALYEVMGFYGTENVINKIKELLEIDENNCKLTFRMWCGVVAFTERLALFHQGKNTSATDSCDELEKSDFDSYEERKFCLELGTNLRNVLEVIRSVQ